MKTRGRTSAAALAVIGPGGVSLLRRPGSPSELTDEQAEEWRAVVNRLPAEWFPRETHPLLAQYVRHVCTARRVAQLMAAAESAEAFDVGAYDTLGKMAERESRIIASLATKMRLSQQATYDAKKTKPLTNVKKPWDTEAAG